MVAKVNYWKTAEGRARRSALSRTPEHLEKLRIAREGRTTAQVEKATNAIRQWNASTEGKEHAARNLEKIQAEWLFSLENLAHLAQVHDSWARTPEGIAAAQANRRGMQEHVKPLRDRDGDLCQLCLTGIDFRLKKNPLAASVDHIVPVAAGGTDDPSNLWLSHLICNMKKGARHCGREDGTDDPHRN